MLIAYESNTWSRDLNTDFIVSSCLFRPVRLNKNVDKNRYADPDKYRYSGYGVGFYAPLLSCLPNFEWHENVVILGMENSSSMHTDNTKRDILVLCEGPIDELDYAIITAKTKYTLNIIRSKKKICLHFNASSRFLCANSVNVYSFKERNSDISEYPLCLRNSLKYFAVFMIKNKDRNGDVFYFFVHCDTVDISNIIDIPKYLMEKTKWCKSLRKCLFCWFWSCCCYYLVLLNH